MPASLEEVNVSENGSHFLYSDGSDQLEIIPLEYRADSTDYFLMIRHLPHAVWLDSGLPTSQYAQYDIISAAPSMRWITTGCSTRIESATGIIESCDNPFDLLIKALPIKASPNATLPFSGGLLGYFGYDLGRRLENLPTVSKQDIHLPDMVAGLYPWAIVQNHAEKNCFLVINKGLDSAYNFLEITRLCQKPMDFTRFHEARNSINKSINPLKISKFKPLIKEDSYTNSIRRIQDYISAGDCYQVNYAQRFSANYTGDPLDAFLHLRQTLPSPFSGFMEFEGGALISISPERFIRSHGGVAETKPIKGTVARGHSPMQDQQHAEWLLNSEKNRAENLMIVDLLRNDFSKQCDAVTVDSFCELQSFTNVHHLVSTITGQLRSASHPLALLRDSFPGGSITGAPKIRAMEIIEELEPTRRSLYCGSLGYVSCHGEMDTSILIRTLVCSNGQIHCWGGGGITGDSDATEEYQETFAKVSLLMSALEREFHTSLKD
jgi:para-aminobenzoate synthetase component 1